MRTLGVHLQQGLDLIDTPRPSVVAEVDRDGCVVAVTEVAGDAEVVAAVAGGPCLVVVDAPLVARNPTGRRDMEVVLSWLDCPVFPVSRRRLTQVFGGVRGEAIAAAVRAAGGDAVEGVPDVVLRHLMWNAGRTPSTPEVPLADYRVEWLGVRAPRYRPKGTGRANPAGIPAAWRVLATAVDMAGWTPTPAPDDWQAIADAARLDAVACAYTAHLAVTRPGEVLRIGTPTLGEVMIPAGPEMRRRAAVNLARLRQEGAIRI